MRAIVFIVTFALAFGGVTVMDSADTSPNAEPSVSRATTVSR